MGGTSSENGEQGMRDEQGQSERSINGERIVAEQLFVPKKNEARPSIDLAGPRPDVTV
jgi:hypothetical protein